MDMREHFQVGDLVEVVIECSAKGRRVHITHFNESGWAYVSSMLHAPFSEPSSLRLIERVSVADPAKTEPAPPPVPSTPPPLLAHCDRCATLQAKHANLEVDFGDRGQRIERLERAHTEQAAMIRRLEGELRAARGRR